MYTALCRVIVDNKCEFKISSSLDACTFRFNRVFFSFNVILPIDRRPAIEWELLYFPGGSNSLPTLFSNRALSYHVAMYEWSSAAEASRCLQAKNNVRIATGFLILNQEAGGNGCITPVHSSEDSSTTMSSLKWATRPQQKHSLSVLLSPFSIAFARIVPRFGEDFLAVSDFQTVQFCVFTFYELVTAGLFVQISYQHWSGTTGSAVQDRHNVCPHLCIVWKQMLLCCQLFLKICETHGEKNSKSHVFGVAGLQCVPGVFAQGFSEA